MKLTVLTWLKDSSISLIGRTIELIFRSILCLLPLGIYMLLLQKRSKASSINTITVYTKDTSKFQYVFPGFILVSVDPDALNNYILKTRNALQNWISSNKYVLTLLFMVLIVGLMLLSYLKGGI